MNGSQSLPGLALAGWLEEGVRRILRDAALGELGRDLGTAADESLIVAGLDSGDVEIAVSAEPAIELPVPEPEAQQLLVHDESEEDQMEQETRILEPIPAEGEIRITARDWLDEVDAPESTLDFPAIDGDVRHRERIDTPRVRHIFPVPEDADWEVRELKYDHYHHAG